MRYIYYYCDSGYSLVGNNRRRCEYGGNWTGSAPVCLKGELVYSCMIYIEYVVWEHSRRGVLNNTNTCA